MRKSSRLRRLTKTEKAALKRRLQRALSNAVRELRAQEGDKSSQEALAIEIGMDRSYWGDIERGERNITLSSLWQLARALEVAPARLVRTIDKHLHLLEAASPESPTKDPPSKHKKKQR